MRPVPLFLALALALSACATRTPPPLPSGKFRPVNGTEQKGMTKPYEKPEPCPSNPKLLAC